jgi:hypothetical protein
MNLAIVMVIGLVVFRSTLTGLISPPSSLARRNGLYKHVISELP